jgi:hypothetical protein
VDLLSGLWHVSLEGLFQLGPARIVLGPQHPLLGDQQAGSGPPSVILWNRPSQCDSTSEKFSCCNAGHVLADQVPQVTLPATKLMIGTGRSALRGLDQLGELVSLGLHKVQVAERVWPARG